MSDTETRNDLNCGVCGDIFPGDGHEEFLIHTNQHAAEVRPPDLSVTRERLSRDLLTTIGVAETIGDDVLRRVVDDAMHVVEHVVADQFPPGSRTKALRIGVDTVGASGGFDTVMALFLDILDQIVQDQIERTEAGEPRSLDLSITVTPRWDS